MLRYRRIGITVKSGFEEKNEALARILRIVRDAGAEPFLDPKRMDGLSSAQGLDCYSCESDIDLLLILGGDGTILRAVRELSGFSIPLLSVNHGTVGFLSEASLEEAESVLPPLLQGKGMIDERTLLHVRALRRGDEIFDGFALNEAVIAQGMIARLIYLDARVNDELLTTYHADGLIIATPTGSTAYNLAAGGPIVHPNLQATILTPINAHSFTQKPIVISGESVIEVTVVTRETKFGDAAVVLTLDGQVYQPLKTGDCVRAFADRRTVKFLRRKQETFFATLREKHQWGERLE